MSGFDKIEFKDDVQKSAPKGAVAPKSRTRAPQDFVKSQNAEIPMTQKRKQSKSPIKIHRNVYIGLAILVVLIILIAIPAYATYKSALVTYRQSQLVASAVKKQNIALASQEIVKTQADLKDTQKNLHWLHASNAPLTPDPTP